MDGYRIAYRKGGLVTPSGRFIKLDFNRIPVIRNIEQTPEYRAYDAQMTSMQNAEQRAHRYRKSLDASKAANPEPSASTAAVWARLEQMIEKEEDVGRQAINLVPRRMVLAATGDPRFAERQKMQVRNLTDTDLQSFIPYPDRNALLSSVDSAGEQEVAYRGEMSKPDKSGSFVPMLYMKGSDNERLSYEVGAELVPKRLGAKAIRAGKIRRSPEVLLVLLSMINGQRNGKSGLFPEGDNHETIHAVQQKGPVGNGIELGMGMILTDNEADDRMDHYALSTSEAGQANAALKQAISAYRYNNDPALMSENAALDSFLRHFNIFSNDNAYIENGIRTLQHFPPEDVMQALGPESVRTLLHWSNARAFRDAMRAKLKVLPWLQQRQRDLAAATNATYYRSPLGSKYDPADIPGIKQLTPRNKRMLMEIIRKYLARLAEFEQNGTGTYRRVQRFVDGYPALLRASHL